MAISSKIINELGVGQFEGKKTNKISGCIINRIDLVGFQSDSMIIIEDSIINEFSIHACWFKHGLIFQRNHVFKGVDYQMGGHNESPIIFQGNIFLEFFNFFDCYFTSDLIFKRNILYMGSNLLGNQEETWKNQFLGKIDFTENIGRLDING